MSKIIICPVCEGQGIGYDNRYINNHSQTTDIGTIYEIDCQMCNGNGIVSANNIKLSKKIQKGFYPNFEDISLTVELKNKYQNLKSLSEKKEV